MVENFGYFLFVSFACAKERTKEKHTTSTNRYFFLYPHASAS
jgi:hypothetical protein